MHYNHTEGLSELIYKTPDPRVYKGSQKYMLINDEPLMHARENL